MLYEVASIKKRWTDYGTQLFHSNTPRLPQDECRPELLEPEIMLSEIRMAIRKLKAGKSAGQDGIYGEVIKAGGETVVQAMKEIIDNIWKTGEWPSVTGRNQR